MATQVTRPVSLRKRVSLAELPELAARAESYRAALAAAGSHTGLAVGGGRHQCASCTEPWPCKALRLVYPGAGG